MKRVMCLYLPRWPLQRLWKHRPELRAVPVAITQPGAAGARVAFCCERARQAGVRAAMPLAEAQAIAPLLHVQEENPAADLRALKKLAAWAERFSPIVGLEETPAPQALLLDITGCAGCFRGEDRLLQRAVHELGRGGLTARAAIADTLGAAWALARHGKNGFIVARGGSREAVLPLSLAALRLPDNVAAALAELGIERVGQLADWPRDGLPGRFGPLVLKRLDQILGVRRELIAPFRLRPEPQARCSFEYPTDRKGLLDQAVDHLLARIVRTLRERHRGAKHLECWFFREAGAPVRIDLRLFHPTRSLKHLAELLRARLESLRLDAPVSGICLKVPVVEIVPERQLGLFDMDEPAEDLATLIDRLASRCGRGAVTFASLFADPQPEHAFRFHPAIGSATGRRTPERERKKKPAALGLPSALEVDGFCSGPVQMWPAPAPLDVLATINGIPSRFRRMGQEYSVLRSWGPQRIETGWWRGQDTRRDYYIVETGAGARWWIFRSKEDTRWFLHGCFD